LIICWQLGLYADGALGALALAVGTGAVVASVALCATYVRDAGVLQMAAGEDGSVSIRTFGWIQIVIGLVVAGLCVALVLAGVSVSAPTGLLG
ncbi:MAG: hypothetical protein ACK5JT_20455, partial [Hyphomicrobiaceae bacterium]